MSDEFFIINDADESAESVVDSIAKNLQMDNINEVTTDTNVSNIRNYKNKLFLAIFVIAICSFIVFISTGKNRENKDDITEISLENKGQPLGNFTNYTFQDILQVCWNEQQYFDFTTSQWESLPFIKQKEYAQQYRNWYTENNDIKTEKTVTINNVNFVFKLVPPGKFWMGSPFDEKHRNLDEIRHSVLISEAFWVTETEITQEQWEGVLGYNPSRANVVKDMFNPVDSVSWYDCKLFCEKSGFLMLTEAQWEYACRAGTTTPFNTGEDINAQYINYNGNYPYLNQNGIYRAKTVNVASLNNPNAWGLYDFHGSLWEWCYDWYSEKSYHDNNIVDPAGPKYGKVRILRGGSWDKIAQACRSANRGRVDPLEVHNSYGFRCCLSLK